MFKVTFFTTLAVLILFSSVFSQPSPSIVADNVLTNSPLYYNHASNIARSSNDDLIVVWKSDAGQIVFSKYDPTFQTWSPAVDISSAGNLADKAGLAADDAGNIYCVWQQRDASADDYAIYFSKYDGASLVTPVDVTGMTAENEEASIEVSDQGRVFIAWNTGAEPDGFQFIFCIYSDDQGQNWSTPDTISASDGIFGGGSGTAGRPFLAKGNDGKMLCTWHEQPDGHGDREPFFSQYDGSLWSDELYFIDAADSANSMYPTVAVNSHDQIFMLYGSYTSPEKLLMIQKGWNDASWDTTVDTLVAADDQLTKPFLVIDSGDNMYVAFRAIMENDPVGGQEQISYMTSTDRGVSWNGPMRISREFYDAGYVTLGTRQAANGIDVLWRESAHQGQDDDDTTAVVYGSIGLLPPVGIDMYNDITVKDFTLEQNYPNPFNPTTEIQYTVNKPGYYELSVFNVIGKKVSTIVSSNHKTGEYTSQWNGTNDVGMNVASGIYYYQITGKDLTLTKKMVLLR